MKIHLYNYSSILLFLGIVVSYIAFMNGISIYCEINHAAAEINEYKYKNSYYVGVSEIKDRNKIIKAMENIEGNVGITGIVANINDADEYHEGEIIFKQSEDLPYTVDYINEQGEVIIGEDLKKWVYEKDNQKYICLDGISRTIAGYVKSDKSEILNYKLIFTPNSNVLDLYLDENEYLTLECASNNSSIKESVVAFYYENADIAEIFYEEDDNSYIEVGSENDNEKFYIIISLFSIVNCIVISEFWILRRKKEIHIRKLVGFSNMKIFSMLYKNILTIELPAIAVAMVLQGIINIFSGNKFILLNERIAYSLVFVIGSSLLIVLWPTVKLNKFTVSSGMEF